ncbi:Phage antirepressor protein YoqD, KilAC domain [Rosenbergiella nectarea]|uniref:Phage antirepressor protein YoqD, KilAC domain n=1 Tax=Rosenbergiella nectarea TaxID=988801 RepID=A0A1H9N2L3_9GAMM|nr:phage antirepressor KilAC domain-containing protein [Rosenbergiella nectarea]SER29623.1 Phage antirepressor protein YoqD, KilAC domain [Rosenbergiella nectarea]
MNYPVNDQTLTMTSREIAEVTSKRHPDVKRDIEVMFEQLQEDVSKFARIYSDSMNRSQTEYVLDKEHTECLVTGYSAMLRMKVIKRMHELEEKTRVPQTLPEALRLAADLAEQKAELESKLAIAEPKADFVDHYVNATGLMGFREVAKLLKVKENDFRVFLVDNNIMYKLAGKMTPYSQHLDAGRFQLKTGEADNGHAFSQAKFTPKGIQWVAGLLARESIKAA